MRTDVFKIILPISKVNYPPTQKIKRSLIDFYPTIVKKFGLVSKTLFPKSICCKVLSLYKVNKIRKKAVNGAKDLVRKEVSSNLAEDRFVPQFGIHSLPSNAYAIDCFLPICLS